MRKIWKYQLGHSPGIKEIEAPNGAKALCVQAQDFEPTVWLEVEQTPHPMGETMQAKPVLIQSVMTGQDAPIGEYLGTVQLHHGTFVLHYYRIR